jgi:LysM repeat protein
MLIPKGRCILARRSLIGFIFLNVVVTILVTSGIILISESRRSSAPTPPKGLLQVLITATPDPNETPAVVYIVVTATPQSTGSGVAILPTPDTAGGSPSGSTPGTPGSPGAVATFDPSLLPSGIGTIEAPTFTPTDESGCPTYTIKKGDIVGTVAAAYGVTVKDIMRANNLTERDLTRLQIGKTLIIPVNGCGLTTETPTATATPTEEISATPPPTSTTARVVSDAKIEVSAITSPGDITAEGVTIKNISGGQIAIGGWKLRDNHGNVFTFPDYSMYESRLVIVYTREGPTGPLALYWGLPSAIWGYADQTITITDANGKVQATYSAADLGILISQGAAPSGGEGLVPTPTRTAAP